MTIIKKVKPKELFMGRLDHGVDLLEGITDICQKNKIQLGRVEAVGAVQKARLAFYNQKTFEYQFISVDEPLEILKLIGNISLKDGSPFVHAHITLADETGAVYGGHLTTGTITFACEFIIESIVGATLERKFNEETHLPLWAMMK